MNTNSTEDSREVAGEASPALEAGKAPDMLQEEVESTDEGPFPEPGTVSDEGLLNAGPPPPSLDAEIETPPPAQELTDVVSDSAIDAGPPPDSLLTEIESQEEPNSDQTPDAEDEVLRDAGPPPKALILELNEEENPADIET